jgi:hypothetical protein
MVEKIWRKEVVGLKYESGRLYGLLLKIARAVVNWFRNLEPNEGSKWKIEGLGLICNWILNYRVLGVKSVKELYCGLVFGKVRGLIAKC